MKIDIPHNNIRGVYLPEEPMAVEIFDLLLPGDIISFRSITYKPLVARIISKIPRRENRRGYIAQQAVIIVDAGSHAIYLKVIDFAEKHLNIIHAPLERIS